MTLRRKYYGRKSSKDFGRTIKAWRQSARLNLKEAAKLLGIECKSPGAYLCQIEKGKRPIPDKILINVPNVYNIQPEEVLGQAYSPQLHLPILDAIMKPTALPKQIEDYLRDIENQLADEDKQEIAHYAYFLILRRRFALTP